ncbi:ergothioneine biosynthesis protein EgtB [Aerosakkonemataceae cyanobacterium BLCC-F154]|uniref:Ergothioneine biosynthesis protein EgtB n=1 Tax=Floridaenema fluviatile BLCC-F154 TaxID=3153640 RepID=A0ABV4YJ40_9CYAN
MENCRAGTLALFTSVDRETFCCQAHPEFSPIGWHLGHIGYTEALWLLEKCAGKPPQFKQYHPLLTADGLPKKERVFLPSIAEIYSYLETIRNQVFAYLEIAPLEEQERLWRFILQHESQHTEIISFVLQLQRLKNPISHQYFATDKEQMTDDKTEMIEIPAGEFEMGNDSLDALDNERPVRRVYLDKYWIDRYPVTIKQYRQFINVGGYKNSEFWSPEGWQWLQENGITQPLYWREETTQENHPVCGVSWYEADAYARFVGKRLPTEAEWEKAASWDAQNECRRTYPWGEIEPNSQLCNHNNIHQQTTAINTYPNGQSAYGLRDVLGNVWEWTSTWFDGYPGFEFFPYRGYSQVYFDGKHRVLKGGSWATRPWGLRCSFRNWYYPSVRQIIAGFRCASSGNF